jgi:HK97 family phage prohead protease
MKEIRNFDELSVNDNTVTGYAIVFDRESRDLGGFVETIDRDSLKGVIENSDVLCLLNHNEDKGILARSNRGNGSLRLEIDNQGLKYTFETPNTALGCELLEGLKRGDINTSSAAFTVDSDRWEKRSDGTYKRHILKFKELYDVSPVYKPAYDDTSVYIDKRGLDEAKKQESELDTYFKHIRKQFNGQTGID